MLTINADLMESVLVLLAVLLMEQRFLALQELNIEYLYDGTISHMLFN